MYIFSYSTPFSFFLIFVVGFYFLYKLIFSYFIPGTKNAYTKHWEKKNREYIRLANAYTMIHNLFIKPEDLDPPAESRDDPRFIRAVRAQTYNLCQKIKNGEIPEEELEKCREELNKYKHIPKPKA